MHRYRYLMGVIVGDHMLAQQFCSFSNSRFLRQPFMIFASANLYLERKREIFYLERERTIGFSKRKNASHFEVRKRERKFYHPIQLTFLMQTLLFANRKQIHFKCWMKKRYAIYTFLTLMMIAIL